MIYTTLVTILILWLYAFTQLKVGKARITHKVPAPSTDGPEPFLRALRVQANFVENLIMFLPAMWMFAFGWGDIWAAILGAIFFIGRLGYALVYYKTPAKRGVWFIMAWLSTHILILGSAIWVVMELLNTQG